MKCGPCSSVYPEYTTEGTIVPYIHREEKNVIILFPVLEVLYNAQTLSTNIFYACHF